MAESDIQEPRRRRTERPTRRDGSSPSARGTARTRGDARAPRRPASARQDRQARPRARGTTYEVHDLPQQRQRRSSQQQMRRRQELMRRRRNLNIALTVFAVALVIVLISLVVNISRCTSERRAEREAAKVQVTEAEAEPVRLNVMMVGDILMHRGIWESAAQPDGTYNFDHIFAHIKEDLSEADIKMLDQETVLTGTDSSTWSGYPLFSSAQQVGDAEVKAGFNVILAASNHSMDQGDKGIRAELEFWREKHPDTLVVGLSMPGEETAAATGPVYYEQDGFKVAIINHTASLNGIADPSDAVEEFNIDTADFDIDDLKKEVAEAEEEADITIVCPHWGDENATKPNQYQVRLAEMMADWGVDVVFGNHPHIIEPIEVVVGSNGHQMVCFYSVGNYISTMIDKVNLVGGIAKVTLVKEANGNARVTAYGFTPLVTHRGSGDEMTTYRLRDFTNELAETNYWPVRPTDPKIYPSEADEFIAGVLGSAYNTETHEFTATLGPDVAVAETPMTSEEPAA